MVEAATQSVNPQFLPSTYLDGSGNLKPGVTQEKAAEVSQGIQARVSDMSKAERVIFLALIKSPDFAPAAATSVSDTEAVLTKLEKVAEKLSLTTNANAARLLGRALVELGAQQRQDALGSRLLARTAARAELEAGANKLRDASSDLRSGAQNAMVVGLSAGAVSIAAAGAAGVAGGMTMSKASQGMSSAAQGGGKAASGADDGLTTATQTASTPPIPVAVQVSDDAAGAAAQTAGTPPIPVAAQATDDAAGTAAQTMSEADKQLLGTNAGGLAAIGQGLAASGGAASSMGGAVSGKYSAEGQADSQLDQSDQAKLQAEAEVTKSEGELEASEQQALQEFVNQLIQFLKEMRDAEVEQMAVVTRG